MGQFSWLDCNDSSQILDNHKEDVYVLIPKEFGGGHIHEECYDGYGNFGGNDIYDLVVDWNRKYLKDHPDYRTPHSIKESSYVYEQLKSTYDKLGLEMPKECMKEFGRKVSEYTWYECYSDLSLTREEIVKKLDGYSYRNIGIDIACYDEDNTALPYPSELLGNKLPSFLILSSFEGFPPQGNFLGYNACLATMLLTRLTWRPTGINSGSSYPIIRCYKEERILIT